MRAVFPFSALDNVREFFQQGETLSDVSDLGINALFDIFRNDDTRFIENRHDRRLQTVAFDEIPAGP